IHAATMVTAGVFMVARLNPLYGLSETALAVVAFVGALTSLIAATIGLVQRDIKRIIAYSTISQLGYMFLACGVAAYGAAIFHLYTHAFFKALLFLCAGSVMHAMAGELDIFKMGGLKKYMPITYVTFLLAALSISGIPGLAGFFSKDEILWFAYSSDKSYGKILWFIGTITASMTAFYTFRVLFVVFHGKFRGEVKLLSHLHESPKVMTYPLIILAVFSIIAGYFSVSHFIKPVVGEAVPSVPYEQEKIVMTISISAALLGILLAYYMYVVKPHIPQILCERVQWLYRILFNKYYFDEVYNYLFVKPTLWISKKIVENITDRKVIEGIVNGIPKLLYLTGEKSRPLHTGYLQQYAILMIIGICVILFIVLTV
ncbi:MAG: NADH-quinone oxidoreductase subunit L, partial [Candidatus Omnitrophica bacterium]|nr:NADH-quinone oxidoreductase subunit L [Candidatus Omnitrophota bacterium]